MSRYVIVNADDFGASDGVNRGIIECHRSGILTSTSMMVTGDAVEEAVGLSRENPRLSIGLHWDVTGEDERDFELANHDAVAQEFDLQLNRFRELMERDPTHVDSHHHTHLDESVRELFVELVAPLGVPLRGDGRVSFIGGVYGQWEYGVTDLDHIGVEALQGILRDEVGDGWTEVSCHPGYMTPGYHSIYAAEREVEIRTLTDPRIRATVQELGIELVSYLDLAREEHG